MLLVLLLPVLLYSSSTENEVRSTAVKSIKGAGGNVVQIQPMLAERISVGMTIVMMLMEEGVLVFGSLAFDDSDSLCAD